MQQETQEDPHAWLNKERMRLMPSLYAIQGRLDEKGFKIELDMHADLEKEALIIKAKHEDGTSDTGVIWDFENSATIIRAFDAIVDRLTGIKGVRHV